jgi:hypothetical protein
MFHDCSHNTSRCRHWIKFPRTSIQTSNLILVSTVSSCSSYSEMHSTKQSSVLWRVWSCSCLVHCLHLGLHFHMNLLAYYCVVGPCGSTVVLWLGGMGGASDAPRYVVLSLPPPLPSYKFAVTSLFLTYYAVIFETKFFHDASLAIGVGILVIMFRGCISYCEVFDRSVSSTECVLQ